MRPGQRLPANIDDLDGVVKAAVLLLTLAKDDAAKLLKSLPADAVEQVTRAVAMLGEVPAALSSQVVEEFYALRMASQNVKQGGVDYARTLLKESLDAKLADGFIQQIQSKVERTPFASLQKA